MADFSRPKARPQNRERPIEETGKAGKSQQAEPPLRTFQRLLGDLRGSIDDLRKSGPKAESGRIAPAPSSSGLRTVFPEVHKEALHGRSALERHETPHVERTGADKEAARHILAPDRSGPRALPSAARLAQVLQAEKALVDKGHSVPGELKALSEQIRAGRHREVADLDPQRVQSVLHSALGGPAATERIVSTPAVHALASRHQAMTDVLHGGLREKEEQVANLRGLREPSGRPADKMELTATGAARRSFPSHAGAIRSVASSPPPGSWPTAQRREAARQSDTSQLPASAVQKLQHMLATNEEPHLAAIASEEGSRLDREAQKLRDFPGMQPQARRLRAADRVQSAGSAQAFKAERNELPMPEQGAAEQKAIPAGVTAAPSSAATVSAGKVPGEKGLDGGRQGRMEITGTMTMLGAGGQPAGTARFDGELR